MDTENPPRCQSGRVTAALQRQWTYSSYSRLPDTGTLLRCASASRGVFGSQSSLPWQRRLRKKIRLGTHKPLILGRRETTAARPNLLSVGSDTQQLFRIVMPRSGGASTLALASEVPLDVPSWVDAPPESGPHIRTRT